MNFQIITISELKWAGLNSPNLPHGIHPGFGFEILTAVVMNGYIFWDVAPCIPSSCWFLALLTLQPWRWKHVPPKRRLTSNGLHCAISQKIESILYLFLAAKKREWTLREYNRQSRGLLNESDASCFNTYISLLFQITLRIGGPTFILLLIYLSQNCSFGKYGWEGELHVPNSELL
jgi:hypothetical protein